MAQVARATALEEGRREGQLSELETLRALVQWKQQQLVGIAEGLAALVERRPEEQQQCLGLLVARARSASECRQLPQDAKEEPARSVPEEAAVDAAAASHERAAEESNLQAKAERDPPKDASAPELGALSPASQSPAAGEPETEPETELETASPPEQEQALAPLEQDSSARPPSPEPVPAAKQAPVVAQVPDAADKPAEEASPIKVAAAASTTALSAPKATKDKPTGKLWQVVGGKHEGLLVRKSENLKSQQKTTRLEYGAIIEELHQSGNRIKYRLQNGNGPKEGWVTISLNGKILIEPVSF